MDVNELAGIQVVFAREIMKKYKVNHLFTNPLLCLTPNPPMINITYTHFPKIADADRVNNLGFRVRFENCPIQDLSPANTKKICSVLKQYSELDIYNMTIYKEKSELTVCYAPSSLFPTPILFPPINNIILKVTFIMTKARRRCVTAKTIEGLGNAHTPFSRNYTSMIAQNSIWVDEDTTEAMIQEGFEDLYSYPTSIKLLGDAAFMNFNSKTLFFKALHLHEVHINRTKHFITAAKNSDPDNCKGILGFWGGKTHKPKELYTHLSQHNWNEVNVAPVFWDKYHNIISLFIKFPLQYQDFFLTRLVEASSTTTSSNLNPPKT